ncbi:MAG TPA: glycoside hydrolase family 15 protein, partial [Gaiellaceae bacterium]|nr:glycoside hydrolase family 15 protein [Gaiellaceae bacterium]
FFDWCAAVIGERAETIGAGGRLHARYTVQGRESLVEWPTFQVDGYGLWLWALRQHLDRHGGSDSRWKRAVGLTLEYLRRHGGEPCVDWWEEREGVHAATLACVDAGLSAWGDAGVVDLGLAEDRLDASLLCLAWPFGRPDGIVERVRGALLSPGGGVHRHPDDVYYGGGEWLLLTAFLGLAELEDGDDESARSRLAWVAAHAEADGHLPEQSQDHLLHPDSWQYWVDKWGPPPTPLLWSHAMFLDLALELGADA